MKPQLKYIELKTGFAHNGPAWIGYVDFSTSGRTIYFNGKALKGNGHGICFDLVTRELYWVTGIKKNGKDRHWLGNGKIQIDKVAVQEYLTRANLDNLDTKKYIVIEIPKTDKSRFTQIENSKLDSSEEDSKYLDLEDLTSEELDKVILDLKEMEGKTSPNNGLKYYTSKRIEAEKRLMKLRTTL